MAVILCVVLMFIFYFKWYMNRLLIPLGHLTEGMRQVEHRNLDTPGGNVQTAGYRPDDFHLQQHGGAD